MDRKEEDDQNAEVVDEPEPEPESEPEFDSFKEYANHFLNTEFKTLTEGDCLRHYTIYRNKTGQSLSITNLVSELKSFIQDKDSTFQLRIKEKNV